MISPLWCRRPPDTGADTKLRGGRPLDTGQARYAWARHHAWCTVCGRRHWERPFRRDLLCDVGRQLYDRWAELAQEEWDLEPVGMG